MALQRTHIVYKKVYYPHYFLCNYLPRLAGADNLSRSLLKFKEKRQPDLDAWIDCTLELASGIPLPPGTVILRALHHLETTVRDDKLSALDLLGERLALHFQASWCPTLIGKKRTTCEIKSFSRTERRTELQDVYFTTPTPLPPATTSCLLIDDVLTTGTTFRMIIAALHLTFPALPVQLFTLARSGYDKTLNRSTALRGQNYQLEQGGWTSIAEEPQQEYSTGKLRECIRANSF